MRYFLSAFADEISPDLDEQLSTLRRLEVGGLDLRSVQGKNVLDLTDDEVRQVRRKCEAASIIPQAVGSPVNKVMLTDHNREIELGRLERAINVAKLLGIARIRIFTPEAPMGTDPWDEVCAWMCEQVELAEDNDILLLHENDARFYGAYPDNSKRLLAEFGGKNFRAAFDFANTVLLGYRPWDDWFPWILPHLDTLHIKDAQDGVILPAGQGDGQMERTFRWLVEQGWEGTLTLEPHLQATGPFGGFTGDQLFESAVTALRATLAAAGAEA
ncbi:MAG TPA: TIM barrel protein [Fimbriimonas sp.]